MYRVTVDGPAQDQIDALPPTGQQAWRELRTALEIAPGNGRPLFTDVPDGLRAFVFGGGGEGLAFYVIVEHAREVVVVNLQWLG